MTKLKPCPFCGGNAVMQTISRAQAIKSNPDKKEALMTYPEKFIRMGCETEDCILYYDTEKGLIKLGFHTGHEREAIKKWNRRTDA